MFAREYSAIVEFFLRQYYSFLSVRLPPRQGRKTGTVTHFQTAIIQYIKSSAGKQVRIAIVAFSVRVGCEVRLKNAAIAVGIVFVAFKDCAAGINQGSRAV